jgi:ribonuclease VapC
VVTDGCFVDTSAIVEVALAEEFSESVTAVLERADRSAVAAPSLVEAVLVLQQRFGHDPRPWIDAFLRKSNLEVIPFGAEHYRLAGEAFLRFGKGRHPARLNYGDCMAYAGATLLNWPLLYIGGDFGLTDVRSALN